jgi:hypothetical protein
VENTIGAYAQLGHPAAPFGSNRSGDRCLGAPHIAEGAGCRSPPRNMGGRLFFSDPTSTTVVLSDRR